MASDLHPDPQRICPDARAPRPDAPGLRVLVVEDDADQAAWLGRLGHQVRVAPDGPAALRAAEATRPDVVLLDIGLPGMDGYEVAVRVHEELAPAMPKAPPVIAVTGRVGEEDRRRSPQASIDLHLTKPVDPVLLFWVLRRFQNIVQ
jgi:CheY-like chemotaxis protein